MRIVSIVTAVVVMAALYFFVFERDRLQDWAGVSSAPEVAEEASPAPQPLAPQTGAFGVVVMKSTAQPVTDAVLVRGLTEAARQVDVRSETSGLVISEPLRKGSNVEKGTLLCQLDPGTREINLAESRARLAEALSRVPEAEARLPETQARLKEAEARLSEATINLTAAKGLLSGGFASESRVASAEAAFESAEAAVQTARAGLASGQSGVEAAKAGIQSAEAGVAAAEREISKLTIAAPFSGILESDAAETGSLMQPGALCATVIQLDPVKLVGFVPESEIADIVAGAAARGKLLSGQEVFGQVSFISRSADQSTRTFRVEVEVPNPDVRIGDGQTVEIVIAAKGTTAHLLPMSALSLDDEGDIGVRTLETGNTVGFTRVEILRDSADGIWVTGLPEIVDIIVVGQDFVSVGSRVNPTYQEPGK